MTPHAVDLERLPELRPAGGCVLTVGNFDGVHRGHQALLERGHAEAAARDLPLVALTFEPHTRHFLDPAGGPLLLSTWREREFLLRRHGADQVVTLRFDDAVRVLSPEGYIDALVEGLGVRHLVLGYDHRFGRGGRGTPAGIAGYCESRGVGLSIVPAREVEGAVVNSTRIRESLLRPGGFDDAVAMLGHPWLLLGEVVHGDGRGRTIGFPTANLEPLNPRKLLPANGVYAGLLHACESEDPASCDIGRPCVVNIGLAPTFERGLQVVEAHVPGGPGPDYGQVCRLELYFYLRPERRFESLDALKERIAQDAKEALEMLKTPSREADSAKSAGE